MTRRFAAIVLGVGFATSGAPAVAGGATSGAQTPLEASVSLPGAAPRVTPYSRLFPVPEGTARESRRQAPLFPARRQTPDGPKKVAPTEIEGPTVVCGMTVIPGDAQIDPHMLIAPPRRGDTPRFTIRVVEPPICR